ncbi:hypothetical protein TH15_20305 [Thalassospira profundimaris]|nr:hypothetical protein TH15_20305 [Thalassospira profundimaris]
MDTRITVSDTMNHATSRAAIAVYSNGAARDLGRRNITVNIVQAGIMNMAFKSKNKLPVSF